MAFTCIRCVIFRCGWADHRVVGTVSSYPQRGLCVQAVDSVYSASAKSDVLVGGGGGGISLFTAHFSQATHKWISPMSSSACSDWEVVDQQQKLKQWNNSK